MDKVRFAQEKDIPQIMDLLVQVDMVHHNGRPDIFKGPATKYTEEELKELLKNELYVIFVRVDDSDSAIGHAFCIHMQETHNNVLTDIKTLYIDDICVNEKNRGEHVGSDLYNAVIAYARKKGYYNVTLNVWSCNPTAMKFYESMGLVPQKVCLEKIL